MKKKCRCFSEVVSAFPNVGRSQTFFNFGFLSDRRIVVPNISFFDCSDATTIMGRHDLQRQQWI